MVNLFKNNKNEKKINITIMNKHIIRMKNDVMMTHRHYSAKAFSSELIRQ